MLPLPPEYDMMKKQNEKLFNDIQNKNNTISKLNIDVNELKDKLNRKDRMISELQQKNVNIPNNINTIQELSNKVDQYETMIEQNRIKYNQLKNDYLKIQQMYNEKPKQPLPGDEKRNYISHIDQLQNKLNQLTVDKTKLEGIIRDLQSQISLSSQNFKFDIENPKSQNQYQMKLKIVQIISLYCLYYQYQNEISRLQDELKKYKDALNYSAQERDELREKLISYDQATENAIKEYQTTLQYLHNLEQHIKQNENSNELEELKDNLAKTQTQSYHLQSLLKSYKEVYILLFIMLIYLLWNRRHLFIILLIKEL